MHASLPSIAGEDDRGAVRLRLLVDASVDAPSDASTDLVVHDLSATGILFEAGAGFEPPSVVRLDLPVVGVREAKIVWSGGRYRGAQFITPLAPSSVRAVYNRSKVVWPSFSSGPPSFSSGQTAGIRSRTAIEAASAADDPDATVPAALAPGLKIQFVVGLAVSLWAALAFAARMLTA